MIRILVGVALLLAGSARAESPVELEAKQHFVEAQRLFERAHYAEALVEYQQSYALSRYPAILHKIALCHDQLGHVREAIEAYRTYLAEDPKTDRRAGTEARIARLEQPVALPPAPPPVPPTKVEPAPVAVAVTPVDKPVSVSSKPAPTPKKSWGWTVLGVVVVGAGVIGIGLGIGLGLSQSSGFEPNLGTFSN